MPNIFESVPNNAQKKTGFDLSHMRKFSAKMGVLTPISCMEVLPGDTFKINSESMIRFAPMLAPVMHAVDTHIHHFFVPNRLVFDKWQDFITGGEDGNDTTVPPFIRVDENNYDLYFGKGTLGDYLGLSMRYANPDHWMSGVHLDINALPFRAYQLIFNEFYRDQQLIDKIELAKTPGQVTPEEEIAINGLRIRAWEKDYFTSARPSAQLGNPLTIPVTGDAPVVYQTGTTATQNLRAPGSGNINDGEHLIANLQGQGQNMNLKMATATSLHALNIDPNGTLSADLSNVIASTINDLRKAFQIQVFMERNMRSGNRYIESLLSHWGVRSSDARLQRPEYLGGGKSPVVMSEILQTSATQADSAQGNMSGHGLSVGNTNAVTRYFEEHGFIISIMSVVPRTAYQQGISRMWTRFDKFDYPWPEFAHLGEQEVLNKEIFYAHDAETPEEAEAINNAVFGYQSRYAEMKYIPSTVHGDFKDNLSFWHIGQIYSERPYLNKSFIECKPRTDIFAITEDKNQHLWCQVYNNIKALRPLPLFGEPGYIDHP